MKVKNNFKRFRQVFIHPRVIIFILIGTSIIFLTFLTDNNALEIAISGLASVFIGIGVNNFSSFETHVKDEQKIGNKIEHALIIMEIANSKINKVHADIDNGNCEDLIHEINELKQFVNLSISLMKEVETI